MNQKLKISLIALISFLIVIQFFDPTPVNTLTDSSSNIFTYRLATKEARRLVETACFDCHSNETLYPWYAYVAPSSWFIHNHVEEGREHVNFSQWTRYTPDEQEDILEESIEEIEEGHMPLKSYRWLHPKARLTEEEKQQLIDFFMN